MKISIAKLPNTQAELEQLPEFSLKTPFSTAAMYIATLHVYQTNPEEFYAMVDYLKGPTKLSTTEKQFIKDRMSNKKTYLGNAYFEGANPQNNYEPNKPYVVDIEENPYSYAEDGYAVLHVKTTGADTRRPIKLRKKQDDWYVWDAPGIFSDIRIPIKEDSWS